MKLKFQQLQQQQQQEFKFYFENTKISKFNDLFVSGCVSDF